MHTSRHHVVEITALLGSLAISQLQLHRGSEYLSSTDISPTRGVKGTSISEPTYSLRPIWVLDSRFGFVLTSPNRFDVWWRPVRFSKTPITRSTIYLESTDYLFQNRVKPVGLPRSTEVLLISVSQRHWATDPRLQTTLHLTT